MKHESTEQARFGLMGYAGPALDILLLFETPNRTISLHLDSASEKRLIDALKNRWQRPSVRPAEPAT